MKIMGIINATPDSFSDGGQFDTTDQAIKHGKTMIEEGASILDIGGESTRPGAEIIAPEEEIKRVVPIIEGLKGYEISIDTRNAKTMRSGLDAGATIVNDISALRHDSKSVEVVSEAGCPVCLMHMQGTPQDMQNQPQYNDVIDELCAFFEERLEFCISNGINQSKIILDPGIGFGKTLEHNLKILRNIDAFKRFGCQVLIGVSRKSFIGKISGEQDPKKRLPGSIAAALYALEKGADIIRVHDVTETYQALEVYAGIVSAPGADALPT